VFCVILFKDSRLPPPGADRSHRVADLDPDSGSGHGMIAGALKSVTRAGLST
jgi:hypothetical protein